MASSCVNDGGWYGNDPNANNFWNIVHCFDNVEAGCQNWEASYCYSLTFYCVASLVNIAILVMLLRFAYYSFKTTWSQAFRKPKIWILTLAIALNVFLFIHYFFYWDNVKIALAELFICDVLKFMCYVALFHYFVKAAANLIGKGQAKVMRDRLNDFSVTTLIVWAMFIVVYIIWAIVNSRRETSKGACKLPTFIAQSALVMIVCIAFACSAHTI